MSTSAAPDSPSRTQVWRMFDRIAHRYDLLNRLLSFGRDVAWRKRILRHLPAGEGLRVLDLATGTADVLLTLRQGSSRVASGVGLDPSLGMLRFGHEKIAKRGLAPSLKLLRGDGAALPLASSQFDVVTISFGIRNYEAMQQGLEEMHRVLRPGGRLMILEFSLPPNRLFRMLYLFYFRNILPLLGGLISGDSHAYRYLNKTVETFPYGEAFCAHLRQAGFAKVQPVLLTMGIATLYIADK